MINDLSHQPKTNMDNNIATIQKFYTAFQQKDYATMNSCYADDIPFSDPVYGLLKGHETKAMWQMLCTRAKDFSLQFQNIKLMMANITPVSGRHLTFFPKQIEGSSIFARHICV